jgi:hypothetical protein
MENPDGSNAFAGVCIYNNIDNIKVLPSQEELKAVFNDLYDK